MDLLFKRYASPYLLIDQMISVGQFSEFVSELLKFNSDSELWQFFLHKVMNQSFDEWKDSLKLANAEVNSQDFETTINDSFSIMQGFTPEI